MQLRRIFTVSVFALFLAFSGPGSFAGMQGGMKSGDHSKMPSGSSEGGHMMGDHSGKGHMSGDTHGEGMIGHGSMGEHLFDGEAFGTNISASIVDVKAQMAKMGKGTGAPSGITHHLRLTPEKPLGEGTDGKVVITYPGGKQEEVGLMAMGGHIGGDLNLDEKGQYQFQCIVTKGSESTTLEFGYVVE